MYSENARERLISIISECPTGDPLETCPVAPLRELSTEAWTEVVARIGQDITEQLLAYHEACMNERRSS